jgi:uncharacterized protein (TIGR02996 family)
MAKRAVDPLPPGLLDAVLADPDDDAARQVYADALEERGDPRGEFIAVQLALARVEGQKPTSKTEDLWERFRALHSRHASKWAKPVRALSKKVRWEFHRGFVRRVQLADAEVVTHEALATLFAVEPVTHIAIRGQWVEWIVTALETPGISRLRRLTILTTQDPATKKLTTALAHADLPALGELRIGLIGDEDVAELVAARAMPALRHLAIGSARRLTATGLATLLESPLGKQLHTLEIGRCQITAPMQALVIASGLERFAASVGWFENEPELRARFGSSFVIENEASFGYLLDGVTGLSKETWPNA